MFKKMPVCRLMISCPSDVKTEIEIINRVVDNINDSIGFSMNIFVKTLYWSKNVMPEAGDYPQSIINKQILDKSDAIIAIFGNKIGSPTQHYESGTIEEIELMIQKRKQVFVYFSDKPVRKSEIDMEAEAKIQAFKEKYRDRGIYVVYGSDEEFNYYVSMHLTRYLTTELANEVNQVSENTRFDDSILQGKEVDLIHDYTKFYDIKKVTSYADSSIMKIRTYGNSFDVVSSGDIVAFQLEIKDDIRNKIIDRTLQVSGAVEHFKIWLPSTTRDLSAWRKISQVCFIVFFNNIYIDGKKGILTIRNLKMVQK